VICNCLTAPISAPAAGIGDFDTTPMINRPSLGALRRKIGTPLGMTAMVLQRSSSLDDEELLRNSLLGPQMRREDPTQSGGNVVGIDLVNGDGEMNPSMAPFGSAEARMTLVAA